MIENVIYKIKAIVNNLELDLSDKIVLTEAATGAYAVTPVIAAYAGAKVFAFTQSSSYGSVEEVKQQTRLLSEQLHITNKIEIITELKSDIISKADIITNSGHLRPINATILKFAKKGCVIPSMYEDWEFRNEDIDIEFCRSKNIKVIATNERHPQINVFDYLGELAIKQIENAGKSISDNIFIVIANNDFGPYIANTIAGLAKKVGVYDILSRKDQYNKNVEWLGEFSNIRIPQEYVNSEAIIFTANPFMHKWFSGNDDLNIEIFQKLKSPLVIRYAGDIDTNLFDKNKIAYYPKKVKPGHMGILLSEIGFDPIIKLQAGGLKVAQLALKNEYIFNNNKIGSLI